MDISEIRQKMTPIVKKLASLGGLFDLEGQKKKLPFGKQNDRT